MAQSVKGGVTGTLGAVSGAANLAASGLNNELTAGVTGALGDLGNLMEEEKEESPFEEYFKKQKEVKKIEIINDEKIANKHL